MSDDLLTYYNREIAYLRQMAGEFASANPKIAGHLRLSGDAIDDPHVARLMEGVAFLNARIGRKLDDEFPELVNAMLEVLYPHYLAPIPSMATVQFQPKAEITGPQFIPPDTELESEPVQGEVCRFRTRYPVTLWPFVLADAAMTGRPLVAPANPAADGAAAVLRLSLKCTTPGLTFTQLQPDRIRFFLRGQPHQVYALQQLILNNTVSVALADGVGDPNPVLLPPSAVSPVGFADDENMQPYPPQSQRAYRLLTEFFVFPEKFLFIDIDISAKVLRGAGPNMDIFFYFNDTDVTLERTVSKELFALGCTPIINLFPQRAEPLVASHNRYEHRVIPDARRQGVLEVHSIISVVGTDAAGAQRPILPFYARNKSGEEAAEPAYWTTARRPAGGRDPGTEVFMSVVDREQDLSPHKELVLSLETLCLNRDLPAKLPYGGGHPYLKPVQGIGTVGAISCISPPTRTLRPGSAEGYRWQLISHLILNHLSITGPKGLEALKEILRLYDLLDSAETYRITDGIVALTAQRGTARAPVRPGDVPWGDAICRGIDISIEFDPAHFSGSSIFLFSMVLDRFFGLYASINSFTRLTATVKGKSGILRTWPARAGYRPLL
ncbi:type VI secretion system baseplate subunit TssF [Azorhizobium sp. AG788]|uniref:type VI secretion system baseplate subunit TssF n=1 Tax=Azorhizobium sp. AG788 TaxID=2183897 RepID=UPI003139E484